MVVLQLWHVAAAPERSGRRHQAPSFGTDFVAGTACRSPLLSVGELPGLYHIDAADVCPPLAHVLFTA